MLALDRTRSSSGEVSGGTSWHNVRAKPGAYEGTKTAALPTFGAEGQFSAAFQTGC